MMDKLERNWCAVMRFGGKTEWKWAWQASQSDEWAHKRTQILSAMSCSQDRSRLKQLLSRVFHPTIDQDPQDTFTMIDKMAENPAARSMVLGFIKTNWDFLGRQYEFYHLIIISMYVVFIISIIYISLTRSSDRLKLLTSASKYLSSPKELEEV